MLHGAGRGLGEIRFKVSKVCYRPIGYFGPERQHFTVLIGTIKKGNRFNPINACNTAQKRLKKIPTDRRCVREFEF